MNSRAGLQPNQSQPSKAIAMTIIIITSIQRWTFRFSKLLGFETFANVLRVSVSVLENLVLERKSRFRFRKIWSRKKVSVSVLENLVSEKSFGFRKFGLKKSRFWFWKTWSRKRKNQSNKKESRPSKQSKSLFEF